MPSHIAAYEIQRKVLGHDNRTEDVLCFMELPIHGRYAQTHLL